MDSSPEITLPDDLIPADGRFGSGPSRVRTEALVALGVSGTSLMGTSHRQAPVKQLVHRIRVGLSRLYDLPHGYEVIVGVGGASAFWDAASFGLIRRRSQHAVFGVFSSKFADVTRTAPHLEDPEVLEVPVGHRPTPVQSNDVDVYALTHNETSTGVAMPIVRPAHDEALVLVDATSAAGAMEVEPPAFDAYYFSPQKAFGSEGGLWVAIVSPRAIARIDEIAASDRWCPAFLDLRLAVENSRKDQTYNTPAVATLFLLATQIEWMLEMGGLSWAAQRARATSGHIYGWADASPYASPFVPDPADRSTTVVTINLMEHISADVISEILRSNGIVDTGSYRTLGLNQLRFATFPNVPTADAERLTAAVDYIVERLGDR
ncbi:MAG: phosphoserine transaminase [Acidimicrobiia bacterium]|nr:phosphoserine transaminase [Acidimicrobiia bacterium]